MDRKSTLDARQQGFTLVELLVVIAIIAVLAGLLVPTIMSGRQSADRAVCLGNLKQIAQLAMVYAQDHDNVYPTASGTRPAAYRSLQILLGSTTYLKPDLFICPSSRDLRAMPDEDGGFILGENSSSYAWVGSETKLTAPGDLALASDDSIRDWAKGIHENHDGGINVVYVGTDAEWVPTDMLPEGFTLPLGLVDNQGKRGNE